MEDTNCICVIITYTCHGHGFLYVAEMLLCQHSLTVEYRCDDPPQHCLYTMTSTGRDSNCFGNKNKSCKLIVHVILTFLSLPNEESEFVSTMRMESTIWPTLKWWNFADITDIILPHGVPPCLLQQARMGRGSSAPNSQGNY